MICPQHLTEWNQFLSPLASRFADVGEQLGRQIGAGPQHRNEQFQIAPHDGGDVVTQCLVREQPVEGDVAVDQIDCLNDQWMGALRQSVGQRSATNQDRLERQIFVS